MIFSRWRRYPKRKPRKNGFYLCTVIHPYDDSINMVMILKYSKESDKWTNTFRKAVFDGYVVYKPCRAPIEDNRVYSDGLCRLTENVVAWRKLPNGYNKP